MASDGRRWRLVRASRDAVPDRVRRFFMARRRRLRDLARRQRRVAAVTVTLVVILLTAWLLWGTSLLGVSQIRVVGAEIVTAEQVREAASVPVRTPLLRLRTGEVAARVAQLPAVAAVEVSRQWPDTVVIQVRERTPVAAVPTEDGFLLLDADAVAFHQVPTAPAELPVVVLGQPGPSDPATQAALRVLASLTPQLAEELVSLTVAGPANIRLELFSGWTVVWGDDSESDVKAQVATALLDREGEIMDVSAPRVVSVR